MAQILAPFAIAVVVFIAFYALGLVAGLLIFILGSIAALFSMDNLLDFFEVAIEEVPYFFFLADDVYPIGGAVVAVIVWIILTCIAEMWITDEW